MYRRWDCVYLDSGHVYMYLGPGRLYPGLDPVFLGDTVHVYLVSVHVHWGSSPVDLDPSCGHLGLDCLYLSGTGYVYLGPGHVCLATDVVYLRSGLAHLGWGEAESLWSGVPRLRFRKPMLKSLL